MSSQREDDILPIDSRICVIGAGAVGTALALAFKKAGHPIEGVYSRTEKSAKNLAVRVRASTWGTCLDELQESALLFLCVPDDQIEIVASRLSDLSHDWDKVTVLHTSGVLSSSALEPLRLQGASTLSFHPVVPVARGSTAAVFENMYMVLEGEESKQGEVLARRIGAQPMLIPAKSKALYHAAAVLVSNGMVALMDAGVEMLAESGIDEDQALSMLRPLMLRTASNLANDNPHSVVTGPVSRGDSQTIQLHVEGIKSSIVDVGVLYCALSQRLSKISQENGRLTAVEAEEIESILRKVQDPVP